MDHTVAEEVQDNETLLKELNDDFTNTVLPVTIFVGFEVVLGFVGNALVIYVFLFRYHVCNFRYFVLCLAFIDIISTLTTMPGEMITHLHWYHYPNATLCKIKSFFNMFTVSAEAFCLLTIAIDRYRKVCRPFGWQMNSRTAIAACAAIYIAAFIVSFPVGFLWGICYQTKTYKGVQLTIRICEKDGKYGHTKRPIQYSITTDVILSIVLITLFVLYIFVAKTLLKRGHKQRPPTKVRADQTSSTATDGASSGVIRLNVGTSQGENSSDINDKRVKEIRQREWRVLVKTQPNTSESSATVSEIHKSSISLSQVVPPGRYNDSEVQTDDSRGVTSDEDELDAKRTIRRYTDNRKQISGRSRKTSVKTRLRRKTVIMFVLTLIFMLTTVLYLTLLQFIARSDDVLNNMSHTWKAIYFLFFRLYFINHVINPIVYGLLDPHFRIIVQKMKTK